MAGDEWMIYGANGYTGALLVEHAVSQGLRLVVAGRREKAIRPLAARHGLAYRVFGLDDRAATVRGLDGIGALLLAAGPFSATSAPAVAACLETRTHYVDISGEVAVFEGAQRRHAAAKEAGIVILPGAGFDVVPSDCLAMALHRALPGACSLSLAISMVTAPGPGSIKTAIEGAAEGGWIRRNGELVQVPGAWQSARIPFAHETQWAMTIPWGDLSTAYWSTGIPNVKVYMATPRPAIWLVRGSRLFTGMLRNRVVQGAVKGAVDLFVRGGSRADREKGRSWVWGRVEDASGRAVEGNIETLETTTLTTHTAVDIVTRLLSGEVAAGYTTPSLAFGPDYIAKFPETTVTIDDVATQRT
jgi:short subunit dehydrogenase-like uncharacterized protein